MAARLEADGVDRRIDLRRADHFGDHFAQPVVLAKIDRREAHLLGMREALLVEIADHRHGRAQNPRRRGGRQADRTGARDIDDGADADARPDRAVKAGRQNVRQHREIADFRHRLIAIGEFQQIEIRVGHHDVARLAADPAAHVDIAIGAAGARVIDVQADAGIARFAGAAAPAGDIERHRDDVAFARAVRHPSPFRSLRR